MATAVVADTHTFVWYLDADGRLSDRARRTLDDASAAGEASFISPITLLEVLYLSQRGRVPADAVERLTAVVAADDSAFEIHPIDTAVALAAVEAPWRLGDPADRLIVATARVLGVPLATKDGALHDTDYVETIW